MISTQIDGTAKPKSVLIIAGEKDRLVPFQTQQYSIELARKLLNTDSSRARIEGSLRTEPGANGTELVTCVRLRRPPVSD